MGRRIAIVACLVFSGLSALVYQVIWTRLLGFAFGTTTEAIGTVLAIFFGGMAIGNWLAARRLLRVLQPLRVYAWLELGIGAFALASLPILRALDEIHGWIGVDHAPLAAVLVRIGAAAAVLLPPTVMMGATLPVVARGLVGHDATVGRWSAILYAANTLGAVLGAYACGFFWIPAFGLTRTVIGAGCVNLAVAAVVLAAGGALRAPAVAAAGHAAPSAEERGLRRAFLAFFFVSGFVAIGYEIVWSKVFGIVMEGTLYGFAAVLSAYLLGIAIGSFAAAPVVDRLRDLPRAFGLLHVAIAIAVALGMAAVPYLPWAHKQLAAAVGGGDAVHLLFWLALPIVFVPTALFGAAFPVLIRIYARRAESAGEGMGLAASVNTAGSIGASLLLSFWAVPALGVDVVIYGLVLLDLVAGLLVLAGFQSSTGRDRLAATGAAGAVLLAVAFSFDGVRVERAIAGRWLEPGSLDRYVRGLAHWDRTLRYLDEGRSSIVTIHGMPSMRMLRTNGMPEASFQYFPPYYSLETMFLALLPYLTAEAPDAALVIGLGGANTVNAMRQTGVSRIDVVELEQSVVDAMPVLYEGLENPLADPRVRVVVNDGRNELLLGRHRGTPRYDLIASQPSHPWLLGAANLFTEEFFALVRDNLSEGGVFALWVNGFRTDPESLLAVATSFERVFPGSAVFGVGAQDPRESLILLGARGPVRLDLETARLRMREPDLARFLGLFGISKIEEILAFSEGPGSAFAAIEPGAANTDDNAFVEVRIPRSLDWSTLDFSSIERRLPAGAPVLPDTRGAPDVEAVAGELFDFQGQRGWPFAAKLERLLAAHGAGIAPERMELLRLRATLRAPETRGAALATLRERSAADPRDVAAARLLGEHLAVVSRAWREAADAFARAFAASGDARDAYDAGRALHHVDRELAETWFERIPEPERERFPRLVVYRAERALARGEGADLRRAYDEVRAFRNTPEGRGHAPALDVLADLARALGLGREALAWSELARRERVTEGEPALARARQALAAQALDDANRALEEAAARLPGDPRVSVLAAELALARGDASALERALGDVRWFAPSLESAVGTENRFRAEHGLPLLPAAAAAEVGPTRLPGP
jgi:spermidine synthase